MRHETAQVQFGLFFHTRAAGIVLRVPDEIVQRAVLIEPGVTHLLGFFLDKFGLLLFSLVVMADFGASQSPEPVEGDGRGDDSVGNLDFDGFLTTAWRDRVLHVVNHCQLEVAESEKWKIEWNPEK